MRTKRAAGLSGFALALLVQGCVGGEMAPQPAAPPAGAQGAAAAPSEEDARNRDCQGSYSQSGALINTAAPLRGSIEVHVRVQGSGLTIQSVRNRKSDGPPVVATGSPGLNAVFSNRVRLKNLTLGSLMSGALSIPGPGGTIAYLINGFCGPPAM